MYGNKYILVDSSSTFMDSIVKIINGYISVFADNTFKKELLLKITLPHNIILLFFLCFLIACFILRFTVWAFIKGMLCCCVSKQITNAFRNRSIRM